MTEDLLDPKKYRTVLGHYPTGVSVVTAVRPDGEPAAMVVGSLTSVSLDPPLIGFFPDKGSSSWRKLSEVDRFCINVVAAEQGALCARLASRDPDKFAGIHYRLSPYGSPIIEGVVAWMDCGLYSVTDAGDHYFVLGEVKDLAVEEGGKPLLFFKGEYGSFAAF